MIVDEAGQLTQPGAFVAMGVKHKRCIFIGDQKQLRPTVQSYAAQIAGLWTSVMGWQEQRRYVCNDINVNILQHISKLFSTFFLDFNSEHGQC